MYALIGWDPDAPENKGTLPPILVSLNLHERWRSNDEEELTPIGLFLTPDESPLGVAEILFSGPPDRLTVIHEVAHWLEWSRTGASSGEDDHGNSFAAAYTEMFETASRLLET